MIEIGFFGFNETAIVELLNHEAFNVRYVITQRGRLGIVVKKLLSVLQISVEEVSNKTELQDYEDLIHTAQMVLISHFGIIVPKEIFDSIPCFNIHMGDLHINRGPYPLVWDFLLKRNKSVSTLHRLGEKIDTGVVISTCEVPIEENDNIETIESKLNDVIKIHIDRLSKYDQRRNYEVVVDGIYRKQINQETVTLHESDSFDEIDRKIKSQSKYGGALLAWNGYKIRVSKVIAEE